MALPVLAAAVTLAALPGTSRAESPSIPAPAWFENAVASGTAAPGTNCDWAYQAHEDYPPGAFDPGSPAVGDYIWILPATLAGSVYSPPDPSFAVSHGTGCTRNLAGGRTVACAAWEQGGYPDLSRYDLFAVCSVNFGLCARQYHHSQNSGVVYLNDDVGSLDCQFATSRKKCKKKAVKRDAAASKKRKGKCGRGGKGHGG